MHTYAYTEYIYIYTISLPTYLKHLIITVRFLHFKFHTLN